MSDNVLDFNSNQKMLIDEDITFSKIIDMSPEEFKKYCGGKNATVLLGLKNLLAATYVTVENAKDKVVEMMVKDIGVKQDPAYNKYLQDLYVLLQDLEDKATYICALVSAPLN